jgi:uncharacterized protein (DUF2147 family)
MDRLTLSSVFRPSGALRSLALSVPVVALWLLAGNTLGRTAEGGREDVHGIWATSGTMIEVKAVGDSLSARIVALKNPNWREKDEIGVVGEPKTDLRNSDAAQRQKPLIGLEMLSEYKFRKGRWRGQLYLPSNGTSWNSNVRLKDGELLIRGYLGVSLFGKTQTFAPLSACDDNILRMIEIAAMTNTPCNRTAH